MLVDEVWTTADLEAAVAEQRAALRANGRPITSSNWHETAEHRLANAARTIEEAVDAENPRAESFAERLAAKVRGVAKRREAP